MEEFNGIHQEHVNLARTDYWCPKANGCASSIAVRLLAYCAEDHGSEPTSSQWLDGRSLSIRMRMGTQWKRWRDKVARKGTGHPVSQS